MSFPEESDYIDIHTHGAGVTPGIFSVENLMAHEGKTPEEVRGMAFTYGIHPWHLNEKNCDQLIRKVSNIASAPGVIAVGEAGFDKIRGASAALQKKAFEEQAEIAREVNKPMVIHCVRAWDDLLAVYKHIKPGKPWLIHGFRGKKDLAMQLTGKGFYLSLWFDFALRPESSALIKHLPVNRIFLETDGANVDIRDIYKKVTDDLDTSVDDLKKMIISNFNEFAR